MQTSTKKANKLLNEKSPYLLQHAYNPVDWYPWTTEAFNKARKENKPIFLSIGYSTCYWCHVMEREVFENEEIANLMNEYFVNIKVDREERPDVDRVYMAMLQAMTGSGGWPMSIFLTPNLKPFFAATYIPPKAKYGRSGFEDIINEIHHLWKNRQGEVIQSSNHVVNFLNEQIEKKLIPDSKTELNVQIFNNAFEIIRSIYDEENGGFGSGNKFPRPVINNFLLSYYYTSKNAEALDIVTYSLLKMYSGGVYDHLAGGFHRYAVDNKWRVPHFEKMLYDQAQIVNSYLDAYLITKRSFYLEVAEETLSYVINYLSNDNGGFYSAEDAESVIISNGLQKKEEGAFYLWEETEVDKILGNDSEIFKYYFGIEKFGNTLNDPHEVFGTKNVLYISKDLYDTSNKFSKSVEEVRDIIYNSKLKLLEARNKRIRPHLDDKILTSWNGLMISAFAKAYQITQKKLYFDIAAKSTEFILSNLYDRNKKTLLHRYRDGESKIEGTLEDYAFFINALIDLYESSFDIKFLTNAIELLETSLNQFYDYTNDGFFDALKNDETILLRTKDTYDGAEPSGNSIQILNLLRLGFILDRKDLLEKAEKCITLFNNEIKKNPFSCPQMLFASNFYFSSPKEIIISGKLKEKNTQNLLREVYNNYIPFKILLLADEKLSKIFPFIKSIVNDQNVPAVYVCKNYKCNLPTDNIETLKKYLNE